MKKKQSPAPVLPGLFGPLPIAESESMASPTSGYPFREPVVLDAPLGDRLKKLGMARAEAGSPDTFKELALLAIDAVARRLSTFTSDDVWVQLGRDGNIREKRALGPIMRQSPSIVATDVFVLTKQPLRHRAPVRVWRSVCRTTIAS